MSLRQAVRLEKAEALADTKIKRQSLIKEHKAALAQT